MTSSADPTSAFSRSQPLSVSPSALSNARLHSIVLPTLVSPKSDKASLKNWGGTFRARPDRVFAPTSVEQCQAIVELARREGKELRAVGRMHSPSDLMFSQQWVVRMAGVKGLLELDHAKPSVTVLAGTYISDVHNILGAADPPLAMTNLGSISEQTMGGLISTASHGTGIHFPVISTAVESLSLICALPASEGGTQVVRCSRSERPELFNASLCGLGLTGLIVSVDLRVGPAFRLRDVSEECPVDFVFGRKTGWPAIEAIESDEAERLPERKASRLPLIGSSAATSDATASHPPRRTRQSIGKLLAHGHKLPPARHDYFPSARSSDATHTWPARRERGEMDVKARGRDEDEDDEETREAQRQIESIVESSQHVRMMWFPQARMVTVRRANRTFEPPVPPTLGERITHQLIGYHLTQFLLYVSRYHQSLPPNVARLVYWLTHPASPSQPSRSMALASTMEKGTSAGGAPAGVASIGRTTEARPYPLEGDVETKGEINSTAGASASTSSASLSAGGTPSGVAAIGRTTEQPAVQPSSAAASSQTSNGTTAHSTSDPSLDIDTFSKGPGVELASLKASSSRTVDSLPPLNPHHPRRSITNTSHLVFNMDCLFPQYTDEWAIPYEHTAACLRAMREWLEEEERNAKDGERIHFPVEVRWTDADNIWLSHCQGRRSCFIGIIQFRPYNQPVRYRRLFAKYEALMRHFAGRPHWAKAHTCGPTELGRLYPHLGDFLELRGKVDPEGVFLNPYTKRHLLGALGEDVGGRVFKSRM